MVRSACVRPLEGIGSRRATARSPRKISMPEKFEAAAISAGSAGAATARCAIRLPAGAAAGRTERNRSGRRSEWRSYLHALVAQLDRASDFESEGREFESLRARHFNQ